MSAVATRTEAEDQLAREFAKVAPELPGGAWVPAVRLAAMRAFGQAGLPHRRIEEWKYTDLRASLKAAHARAGCSQRKVDASLLREALGGELASLPCIRLVLVNGRYVSSSVPVGHESGESWQFSTLAAALGDPDYAWIRPSFESRDAAARSAVRHVNTAFVSDGVVLTVSEGAKLTLPIHIVSVVDASKPVAVATRNIVRIGANAKVTIIESHMGVSVASNERQVSALTEVSVAEGAEVHHLQVVAGGADVVHLGQWGLSLATTAVYRGFQLTAGVGLARLQSDIGFTGPDAKLDLSGLMLGRGRDHIDTTLVVNHTTTGCESRELFKAVLDDRARAVFQGKVVVAPEAQKTDGKQMAQALMLSEDAEFDSKPELEIYADDVACGHGSTAAELDSDMLFYLRSRGIPLPEARALLIESFAAEALEKIENETLRATMRAVAVDWLGAHG